ncbi:MAG: hypothetical protein JWM05_541 [Acidimicrobiales bacterium]|nr:hypothetical protein [Acidimicrobiales bacterium]
MRQYLHWLGHDSVLTIHQNAWWMGWNLFLAVIPAVLGVLLFHRPRRHGPLWWIGVAAFAAFLPNAPYVVTDLIHLPDSIARAHLAGTVVVAVLPAYAALVLVGLASYAIALMEVARAMRREGMVRWVRPVEVIAHVAAAVGVLLGRVIRLNSWTPITHPRSSMRSSASLLTDPYAQVAVVLLAGGIAVAYSLLSGAGRATATWVEARRTRGQPTSAF